MQPRVELADPISNALSAANLAVVLGVPATEPTVVSLGGIADKAAQKRIAAYTSSPFVATEVVEYHTEWQDVMPLCFSPTNTPTVDYYDPTDTRARLDPEDWKYDPTGQRLIISRQPDLAEDFSQPIIINYQAGELTPAKRQAHAALTRALYEQMRGLTPKLNDEQIEELLAQTKYAI